MDEKEVLSYIVKQPDLLNKVDIDKEFFRKQEHRLIFREIAAGNTALQDIAEKIKDQVSLTYIAELGAGTHSGISVDILQSNIRKIKISRLNHEIHKALSAGVNTGKHDDKKLQGLYEEIRRIEESDGASNSKKRWIGTSEEFIDLEIDRVEKLADPIAGRNELIEIGGVKGSHKSFFITLLALHMTSGKSPFLNDYITIQKPTRFILIQQEVSLEEMRHRVEMMKRAGGFTTGNKFIPWTTTGEPLKILNDKDYNEIRRQLDKYKPDTLALDPLATFHVSRENVFEDMAQLLHRFSQLRTEYNLALIFTHHYSSKLKLSDPNAPEELAGWFRGHTTLTDAADVLIGLHRLPGQRDNPNLMKAYEDYNLVQIQLRNGRWPDRFAIEFDEDTFLLKESSVWEEIGKKIFPNQIKALIEANDGEMLQKDVFPNFPGIAATTVKRAIQAAKDQGLIEKDRLPGQGNPVILRI